MGKLEGKVAFITGAARGQGRSHAIRLAEEGADIIAVDACADVASVPYGLATAADLDQTAKLIAGLDRRIVTRHADVRDFDALAAAAAEGAAELGGGIDIVLANAGIVSFGTMAEMPEQTWHDMIDICLTGVWHTVKAAMPHVRDGASITLTSSVAGFKGFANAGHYVAAKHGVVGLMRTLANELGPRGIRVNTVHPTECDTDMLHNPAHYNLFRPDLDGNVSREQFGEATATLHMLPTSWVDARDVSNMIAFLASDEGRFITASTMYVDAGAISK
ncbi:mycofactocin-coupled SDR family oxidoreductase [Pseudonocardia sp. GCM10023141]|uniref:mycofactocin-coupled SDR family oxidoreductase n=1 Tax=Pseudonocardia sp. GCM10023141 TaxID=3252653 RepID=UPI003623C3E8